MWFSFAHHVPISEQSWRNRKNNEHVCEFSEERQHQKWRDERAVIKFTVSAEYGCRLHTMCIFPNILGATEITMKLFANDSKEPQHQKWGNALAVMKFAVSAKSGFRLHTTCMFLKKSGAMKRIRNTHTGEPACARGVKHSLHFFCASKCSKTFVMIIFHLNAQKMLRFAQINFKIGETKKFRNITSKRKKLLEKALKFHRECFAP